MVLYPHAASERVWKIRECRRTRDNGRGSKCIKQSDIPSFINLVLWGHEHEQCLQPTISRTGVGTFLLLTSIGIQYHPTRFFLHHLLSRMRSYRQVCGHLTDQGTQVQGDPHPSSYGIPFVLLLKSRFAP